MRRDTGMRGGRRAGRVGCGVVAMALVLLAPAAGADGEGVAWRARTLEEALAEAQQANAPVMIDVYAAHCAQCQVLDDELWDTAEGAAFAEGLIPLRIPSDEPAGIELQRRYPVLGLPLVMFLKPDGEELGRIVGYTDRRDFLREAEDLKSWLDPLPNYELAVENHPQDRKRILALLERYLYRAREAEAESLLYRLVDLDPNRLAEESTKALGVMARYYEYFKHDPNQALAYWKTIVETFPSSGGVTAGIRATFEQAERRGQVEAWIEWICGIAEAHPYAGRLNYTIAMRAFRSGLRHPCLAKAARIAHSLKIGPAYMDSVATVLEGPPEGEGR